MDVDASVDWAHVYPTLWSRGNAPFFVPLLFGDRN